MRALVDGQTGATDSTSAEDLHLIATLEGGGAERQVAYLGSELQRRGWDVTVAALRMGVNEKRLKRAGVSVINLRHASTKDPLAFVELLSLTRRLAPEVVQTWLPYMDVVGGIAASVAKVPWVATERSDPSRFPTSARTRLRHTRMVRSAKAIVANLEDAVTYYRAHGAVGRVEFVQNGVPLEELTSQQPADKTELGVDRASRLVLLGGRLDEAKDILTISGPSGP